MNRLQPGATTQMAYVTHDLDGMVDRWLKTTNAGPFFMMELTDPDDPNIKRTHRGKPGRDTMKGALAFMGNTMLEFVQPTNDAPSVFRDFLDEHGEFLQHIFPGMRSHTPEEFDARKAAYIASGCPVVTEITSPVFGQTVFFDAIDKIGVFLELVELSPEAFDVIDLIYRAHLDWDGSRPIRLVSDLMSDVLSRARA